MKKKIFLHVGMILAMLVVACVYMSPALGGKAIRQDDMQKGDAMAYRQRMVEEQTGTVPNWAPSMFSGMPGYQIATETPKSVFQPVRNVLVLRPFGVHRNIGVIFLYLLGFYVAMLAFGVSPWLALIGALGFGLGSYNIIIIEAGHISKAWAMAMMAPILAGMVLTFRSAIDRDLEKSKRTVRVVCGSLLFTLALILQLAYNHIQITFYTVIACVAIGVAYLVMAIAKRRFPQFALKVGILIVGAVLAFGCNMRNLLVNEEYVKYTMRGGSELTITPEDLYGDNEANPQNTSSGLDIDYAFNWSYGVGETYTILVPGAYGGASGEKINKEKSSFYNEFRSRYAQYQYPWGDVAPLYWGDQPFTSGPVYFGAIVILLFLVGMIVTRGPERWWILFATIFGMLLSWGSNFMPFNEWMFNNMPMYNKFRTPSMALVLSNVCVAIMAVLALKAVYAEGRNRKLINAGLYVSTGILMAVILIVLVCAGSFSYACSSDQQMETMFGPNCENMKVALVSDRAALLRSDSWRSLLFIILAAVTLWLYNNDKIKKKGITIAIVGVLVLIDLWGVDRRYLNDDNFVEKRQLELHRDQWDYDIDEMAARFGDHDYRVLNMAVNTFNDSKPSAFHNQIGGYSAAKLSRYQNLIDFYMARHINPNVLNMLNTRYLVMNNRQVQRNPEALGNCWFVKEIQPVADANAEILALNTINPAVTALVDTSLFRVPALQYDVDSSDAIVLEQTKPYNSDYLQYKSHTTGERLAVFSEIHYEPDWFAYIDGKPAEYIRVNFVLRAMVVPAGDHVIEFKNEAPRMHRLDNITLVISIVTLLLMIGVALLVYVDDKKKAS